MYNNPSILKRFRKFFTSGSCGLSLEARYLDDLWFMTTQPWSKYSKPKRIFDLQVSLT
jgi:hypothetical protein